MTYDDFEGLIVEKSGGIGVVTLNRPEHRNAITKRLHDEIEMIWPLLAEDDEINVIVLTGAGRAFSAGGDIKNMVERFGTPEGLQRAMNNTFRAKNLIGNMLNVHKPIIAAVNGAAAGLGLTIALACDISVVAETAKVGDTHVRVGLVAGDGCTTLMPLLIGLNRAKELMMRATVMTGAEACAMGLFNHTVPDDEVMTEAMKIAEELNALPPLAIQWTKVSANLFVKQQFNLAFDAGVAFEGLTMLSYDHNEAAKSFLEKRTPHYRRT